MITAEKTIITIEALINAPVEKVWSLYTEPNHVIQWNNPSDDWHTPRGESDLRPGGKFSFRMEARDGSTGFDFSGVYDTVILMKQIKYTMDDGRSANVTFESDDKKTRVTISFDAEQTNSVDMQRQGWQAILDNFKKYVEKSARLHRTRYEIVINASREKVYNIMIDKETYPAWTAVFNPSSRFEGSWQKGTKILFIGESENGSEGMVSRIRENIPNRYISIEHLGLYKNGKEIYCGSEIEAWAGAFENYSFSDKENKTLVSVDMDINPDFKSFFDDTWPKALDKLKSICES